MKSTQREGLIGPEEYVTSWELNGIVKGLERGLAKGLEQGIAKGIEQGRIDAFREILLDLLTTRFGPLDPTIVARVQALSSADQLRHLTHEALLAPALQDLVF